MTESNFVHLNRRDDVLDFDSFYSILLFSIISFFYFIIFCSPILCLRILRLHVLRIPIFFVVILFSFLFAFVFFIFVFFLFFPLPSSFSCTFIFSLLLLFANFFNFSQNPFKLYSFCLPLLYSVLFLSRILLFIY